MEGLIALVLITLSISIGGMVHSRVLSSDRSLDRVRALGMISEMEEGDGVPEDEKWTKRGVRVEREVSLHQGIEGLHRVRYRVYSKGEQDPFMEQKSLVLENR